MKTVFLKIAMDTINILHNLNMLPDTRSESNILGLTSHI